MVEIDMTPTLIDNVLELSEIGDKLVFKKFTFPEVQQYLRIHDTVKRQKIRASKADVSKRRS